MSLEFRPLSVFRVFCVSVCLVCMGLCVCVRARVFTFVCVCMCMYVYVCECVLAYVCMWLVAFACVSVGVGIIYMSHGQNTRRPLYQGGVRFCITHAKTMQNDKVSPKNDNS